MKIGNQYAGRLPHEKGSITSEAAADSMEAPAQSMRENVHAFIVKHEVHGATDEEIERALGMRHQTASARRRELVLAGFVLDSLGTRRTTSGRNATVWIAKAFADRQRPLFESH